MDEKIARVENILKSTFNRDNFELLVKELFDNVNLENGGNFKKELSNFSSHIEESAYIGEYEDPEGKSVVIYAVKLKAANYVENSRSTQRNYAKSIIDGNNYDAAIVAYFNDNDPKWRLSFVRLDYEIKFDSGKLTTEEKLTPARRYSFLVGKGEPCHTAIKQLAHFIEGDNYSPTVNEIEEAFGVERVTKEFYKLYCEKYHQLQEHLLSNEEFQEEAERLGFDCNAFSVQFAKKLMGQIVFMYFLQKKGWLGVNVYPRELTEKEYKAVYYAKSPLKIEIQSVLPHIYQQCEDDIFRLNSGALRMLSEDLDVAIANCLPKKKNWGDGPQDFMRRLFNDAENRELNFFDKYLEPLFYDAMNRNRGEKGYFSTLHCRIPFLFGGLFEPIDGYDWKHTNFSIPNSLFSNKKDERDYESDGILDIFDRFNFTISEDEPMEREVAIDPEMLGKVFENLLEVKDRKSKGAFYTPREIVHYMCQESLIEYLQKATQVPHNDIRNFVLYGDFMKDEDTVKINGNYKTGMFIPKSIFQCKSDGTRVVDRLSDIDKALANVKIADPAVGSGAYPLGLLNEIVKLRETITAYMSIGMTAFQKRNLYVKERSTYALKRNTIKDCIFAVDIDPSAVDIARLRLWLALVIDDIIVTDGDGIFERSNPTPLPNLDCNIICGNSLVDEFMGISLINEAALNENVQQNFGQEEYDYYLTEIIKVQDALYQCDDNHKKEFYKRAIAGLRRKLIMKQLTNEGATDNIIRAFENAEASISKPYILWPIDFVKAFQYNNGFDIVIGNPPYKLCQPSNTDTYYLDYYKRNYEVASYKIDLFHLFFEKSFEIVKQYGVICLITPNTYLTNKYTKPLRKHILDTCKIHKIINHDKIFTSASVDTATIIMSKEKCENNQVTVFQSSKQVVEEICRKEQKEWCIDDDYVFNIKKDDIIKATNCIKLGEICKTYFGIQAYDRKSSISESKLTENYLEMIDGADVHPYIYAKPKVFFNYIPENIKSGGSWDVYSKERIVIRQIGQIPIVGLCSKNTLCSNTIYNIYTKDDRYDLKFLLACLNSSFIKNYWRAKYFDNKALFPKIKGYQLKELPIPNIGKEQQCKVIALVDEVLLLRQSDKNHNTDKIESQIDDIINSLYQE